MSERLIINNKTDQPMSDCLERVLRVVSKGRISGNGESYCYITKFYDETMVAAERKKSSDVFTIWEEQHGS